MKILFFGDVVGRSGRDGLKTHLPTLRTRFAADMVIANVENAAAGHGITASLAKELRTAGVDVMTTGNHVWGQREFLGQIDSLPFVVRPLNYPLGTPGRGFYLHTLPEGRAVLVVNLIARLFMDALVDDPFAALADVLKSYPLGATASAIFVDFHGEASSEKVALAHRFDGFVSAVIGTHTHVPTADARLLGNGTAFMTDAGMCGDYNSVIGLETESAVSRFIRKIPTRAHTASGEATVCGVFVEVSPRGHAERIVPIRVGGVLAGTE